MGITNLEGQILGGRYQIQALIGQGGMASVYKAYDPNLRRAVAIKVIHPHLSSNPEFFRRFEEEATAVAHLRHPNIVQMYDFNHEGDLYFMVMEYVVGETLQMRLKRLNASKRRMGIHEVVEYTADICDAADYAHQRGMIHRDIKPANIMLDVNGKAILMDFGIARMVGGTQHTATGAVLGTAMYMSPEAIRGLQTDGRADIYSLGITLYEMLSGKPPFEADSAMTLMMMHLNDPVPDLCELHPGVPVELVGVVEKSLAKNREARYATAREMGEALRKVPELVEKKAEVATPPVVKKAEVVAPLVVEATMVETAGVKDTGETVIEADVPVIAAKEPSRPEKPTVKPEEMPVKDQATLVEQALKPSTSPSAGALGEPGVGETVAKRRSKVWIAVVAIVLLIILGGGGYLGYTQFLAGEGIFKPSPTITVENIAIVPVTSPTEVIVQATSTLVRRATDTAVPALPTPTELMIPSQAPTGTLSTTVAIGTAYTCTDPLGCVTIGPSDPIHIAYLLAMSGPNSAIGIDSWNGVGIAIDDSGGKILEHPIQFDGADGECTSEGGTAAGTKLAADPSIVAVIGPSCSSEARSALKALSTAGYTIVSPSNTTPDLTDPKSRNHYWGYFRTAYNDIAQGAAAADFVYNDLGFRRVATINDGSLYSEKLTEIFRQEFVRFGGEITASKAISPGDTDMKPVLIDIAAGDPELIYFPVFLPAGTYLIKQAHAIKGLESTELMGGDGLFSPDVMQAGDKFIEGFMVSSPIIQGTGYDRFVIKYKAKFDTQPISIFHAHAYDAFNILKAAIEKVAVTSDDGTIVIPRQALRDAMAATTDFNGLTGILTCNPNGDCADPLIGIYEYHSGDYPPDLIWP